MKKKWKKKFRMHKIIKQTINNSSFFKKLIKATLKYIIYMILTKKYFTLLKSLKKMKNIQSIIKKKEKCYNCLKIIIYLSSSTHTLIKKMIITYGWKKEYVI